MKKTTLYILGALALGLAAMPANGATRKTSAQDEVILHAWSWSLDTIAANMKQIKEAGYDYVQTSPVQTCYVGDGGGMALMSQPGDSVMGKWYYY